MSRSLRHGVISLFIVLAWGTGWLMLWTLGFYLTHKRPAGGAVSCRTASIWRC
ncbi:integral membrane sensor signal transduction histidine kinase [Raoultella ornithinolytica]|nr:integral membrane sensor signal transduction histidine kinase [Raoultella ornithinolytica]